MGPPAPFVVPPISRRQQLSFIPRGALESVWVCVGVAVVALAVGIFAVLLPVRHGAWRRGRRRRWMVAASGLTTVVLLLVSVAAGVNTWVGYVPTVQALLHRVTGDEPPALVGSVPRPRGHVGPGARHVTASLPPSAGGQPITHSQVVQLALHAPSYGLPDAPAYVYLPAGYQPTGPRWPLLMLIGGAPGSADDWLTTGSADTVMDRVVQAHLVKPFVIVIPTTNPDFLTDDECLNTLKGPQVESYLVDFVMPAVEHRLNVALDRHLHAIAGFSAGADCALNVGLHHLGMFSAIATIEAEGRPGLTAEHFLLGDRADLVTRNSPRDYIPTMTFSAPVVVYLNAAGPKGVANSDLLQTELQARGVYVYRHDELIYGHNWRDARADLPWLLDFVSAAFNAPPPAMSAAARPPSI
jgi:hypothetical protein